MGREMKRVAMDFCHPLGETWPGYLCPHTGQCLPCGGSGYTKAAQRLNDLVSLLMLSGSDAMAGKCHPYFHEAPLYRTQGVICGADMVALTSGLAGRAPSFFGHDSCDQWSASKKIIAAAGLPEGWGTCADCSGTGTPPDIYALQEAWQATEPPAGDGFQMWETCSEGSPVSPVFATKEELARWLADTGASRFGREIADFDEWMRIIDGGFSGLILSVPAVTP